MLSPCWEDSTHVDGYLKFLWRFILKDYLCNLRDSDEFNWRKYWSSKNRLNFFSSCCYHGGLEEQFPPNWNIATGGNFIRTCKVNNSEDSGGPWSFQDSHDTSPHFQGSISSMYCWEKKILQIERLPLSHAESSSVPDFILSDVSNLNSSLLL